MTEGGTLKNGQENLGYLANTKAETLKNNAKLILQLIATGTSVLVQISVRDQDGISIGDIFMNSRAEMTYRPSPGFKVSTTSEDSNPWTVTILRSVSRMEEKIEENQELLRLSTAAQLVTCFNYLETGGDAAKIRLRTILANVRNGRGLMFISIDGEIPETQEVSDEMDKVVEFLKNDSGIQALKTTTIMRMKNPLSVNFYLTTESDLDQTKALMSDIAAPSRFIILVADTNSRAVSGSWADTKNVYAGYMLVIKRNVERDGFQMTVNEDIIAKITKAVKSTLIY